MAAGALRHVTGRVVSPWCQTCAPSKNIFNQAFIRLISEANFVRICPNSGLNLANYID